MAEEKETQSKQTESAETPKEAEKSAEVKSEEQPPKPVKTKEDKPEFPELKPGMTVRVHQKIKETNPKGEEKERIQVFEGIIIAKKHGKEAGATITVRKISGGIGVEKIFPLNLPTIAKIEPVKQARVGRAKLYFLRGGFKKRLKETLFEK